MDQERESIAAKCHSFMGHLKVVGDVGLRESNVLLDTYLNIDIITVSFFAVNLPSYRVVAIS